MNRPNRMAVALVTAVVSSAVLPGVAGYVSARLDAVAAAERRLRALEARVAADDRLVALLAGLGRPGGELARKKPAHKVLGRLDELR